MIAAGFVGVRYPPPSTQELEYLKSHSSVLCDSDDVLTEVRPCLTCNQWGNALHNIGAHACRFHALPKNGPSGGRFHGPGVYECCGVSDDPHHEHFNARIGIKGCCKKDHCPIDRIPYPRKIFEKDWPSALREHIYEDINKINMDRTNRTWSQIVKTLNFKGLRIDEQDRFYITRIDEEQCTARTKHKYYKDEKLSKMIRLRCQRKSNTITLLEVIVENTTSIAQMLKKHVPNAQRQELIDTDNTSMTFSQDERCGTLKEGKEYTVNIA